MTEIRIAQGFARFGEPLEPDAAFADSLYATLVDELDLGARRRPVAAMIRRSLVVLRAWREAVRWPASPRWRLATQIALVALLVAALVGLLVIAGSWLNRHPTAAELVTRSQSAYRAAPAMTLTGYGPGVAFVISTDGSGTWRITLDGETSGSYHLYDGLRAATYDASQKTWGIGPLSQRGIPYPFQTEFTWASGDHPESYDRTLIPCSGAVGLGVAEVAGRETDHIVCTDIDMEYWIDQATGIVLRMEPGPTTPHWEGTIGGAAPVVEIRTFHLGIDDPAAFSWSAPDGAFDENNPPASTVLITGQRAPRWTASAVDGRTIDTARLAKPTAFLFCAPTGCARRLPDFQAAAADRDIDAVIVELEYPGTVAGFLTVHPTTLPVVVDAPPDYRLTNAWGLGYPEVVLLSPDGTVASVLE